MSPRGFLLTDMFMQLERAIVAIIHVCDAGVWMVCPGALLGATLVCVPGNLSVVYTIGSPSCAVVVAMTT